MADRDRFTRMKRNTEPTLFPFGTVIVETPVLRGEQIGGRGGLAFILVFIGKFTGTRGTLFGMETDCVGLR